ncbi:peptide/nickel transport system ATP-binding protein [Amycolatopsis lexingtonensis]|uniref:Peptide/nickel transport system ATP-binding protein n=1 Tax=Amycolatopsis lexingtonensis TaxID=218822 RepID=A0ABR9HW05_9PSEU|nr:dipeptide/oligopeptide/nickel ABC transporter ATP-binding protein [Amycolatopsis lexingtonensis]MBE1495106.1 peptide/nickel transport system ATP-binding protein [Amycolatopsis lexingtonensis]
MPLLEVQDLRVGYRPRHPVVDGVGFVVRAGETLGLLGESGSGKSTIGHAIVGLVRPESGRIRFHGEDIAHASARRRRELSQHLQIVFQDPHGSLNPSRTVGSTLAEPLRVVRRLPRRAAEERVAGVLDRVGLPPAAAARYPGSFSGGQLQRIAIARALVLEPELVVCDEPTSALDLSVQAQILNLLLDLQQQLGLSYLFISHDTDVVRFFCHRVVVLRDGRIAERGPVPTRALPAP